MSEKSWITNNNVRVVLNKNYINSQKIMINFVKETAFIKGDLEFQSSNIDESSDMAVINLLKKIEREIFEIKEVKHITWDLTAWIKYKNLWKRKELKKSVGIS